MAPNNKRCFDNGLQTVDNDDDPNTSNDDKIPLSQQAAANVEALWSLYSLHADADLDELTLQERNQVYEDVHGVSQPMEETDQLVATSLAAMKRCLEETPYPNKSSYELALSRNPDYVDNPDFLIVFLRCDRFNAELAAERYVKYYQMVEYAFGPTCLGRELTQADLGPEELKHLREGHVQFLRQRDAAGRAIQFLDPIQLMKMYNGTPEEELVCQRACFYLHMRTVLDSVETQRHGMVSIVYGVDARVKDQAEFVLPQARFIRSVGGGFGSCPFRVTCFHFLSNDARLNPFLALFQRAFQRAIRVRIQIHSGPAQKCHDQLRTYGIPVDSIPINDEGVISYTKHAKTLKKYLTREQDMKEGQSISGVDWSQAVFLPNKNDVLLGRGRPYQDHPGNVHLRDIIGEYWDEYDSAKERGTKGKIAERVAQRVLENGGRFLKVDEKTDWWFPVTEKEIRTKVCQGFRKKREMMNASGVAKKDSTSGKRSKVQTPQPSLTTIEQQPTTTDLVEDHGLDALDLDINIPLPVEDSVDTLNAEELEYLMTGQATPKASIPRMVSNSSETAELDGASKTETNLQEPRAEDAFDDLVARVEDPFPQTIGHNNSTVTSPLQNDSHNPLQNFLESHRYWLKSSPEDSYKWLTGQDILSIADLKDACGDQEFVDLDLVPKGGLKGFKRRPFIKAVNSLVETETVERS